jgi:DNA repair photolyase
MNGKPVHEVPVKTIITMKSGFQEKLLCDGPTFSAGDACAYSCGFCFVEAQLARLGRVAEVLDGSGKPFSEIVIRRKDTLHTVVRQLCSKNNTPLFADPNDKRVIYASPFVDVAANMELVAETTEICRIILKLTNWQIRLLSKSHLLPKIALALEEYKARMIFGVSTGTLDNKLAASFEQGTALVSKRIQSLHWLQDNGYRTFGMVCPSLPHTDYLNFSNDMVAALRIQYLEHVWAEVLNVRGASMIRTIADLNARGYADEANRLKAVSTDKFLWEEYAQATFLAHCQTVPRTKLRFLQYPSSQTLAWW